MKQPQADQKNLKVSAQNPNQTFYSKLEETIKQRLPLVIGEKCDVSKFYGETK